MIEAFPLQWPAGFPRATRQQDSSFQCTLGQARDGVLHQVKLLKGTNVIISSNIPVKRDGQLYASQKPVDGDHGVAVYFTWKNEQFVMACDKYYRIHENLRAIEKSIEAIRGLERWGTSDILARAFTGFKALPESASASVSSWWQILEVEPTASEETVTKAYRSLAKKYHPDNKHTGNQNHFNLITDALEKAKQQNGWKK